MADAVVQVVENRVQVTVYGASLIAPLLAGATAAAQAAEDAADVATEAARSLTIFRDIAYVAANPELDRLRMRLSTRTGEWPAGLEIGVKYLARDDGGPSGTPGDRLLFQIVDASDDSLLFAFLPGGASVDPNVQAGFDGGLGKVTAPLVLSAEAETLGFVQGEAEIDFRDGTNFGAAIAHDPHDAEIMSSRVMFGPVDVAAIGSIAAAAIVARSTAFNDTVTDAYLNSVVRGAKVAGGDSGTSYLINYEMIDTGVAGPTRYRVTFKAYDPVRGKDIGIRQLGGATDPLLDFPTQIFLTQAANGNIDARYDPENPEHNPATDTYYTGEMITLEIDPAALEYGHSMTTYTDPADAGIRPEHVVTNDELDVAIEHPPRPVFQKRIAASGADFTTIQAAYNSMYLAGLEVGRASFPLTDWSTPTHPALIEVVNASHNEEITPTVVVGVGAGLIVPHFSVLRGGGGRVYMDDESTAPVVDMNRSGTIEDLIIEQLGADDGGYGIHIDGAGKLTIPAMEGLPILRYRDRVILRRVTIITHSLHASGSCIGMGFSNGMQVLFDECRFVRVGAGTAPEITCHTSPETGVPGVLHFRNCTGDFTVQLIKSDAMDVQHRLIVENSQVRWIKCANGIGGHSAFVWAGSTAGLTPVAEGAVVDGTYSNLLDDYA